MLFSYYFLLTFIEIIFSISKRLKLCLTIFYVVRYKAELVVATTQPLPDDDDAYFE